MLTPGSHWVADMSERLDGTSTVSQLDLHTHRTGGLSRSDALRRARVLVGAKALGWALVVVALAIAAVALSMRSASLSSPTAYIMAATASGLVSILVAMVFAERWPTTRERRELVCAAAFGTLAIANLLSAAAASSDDGMGSSWRWLASAAGLATSLVALAAIVYPRRGRRGPAPLPVVLVAGIALLAYGDLVALLTNAPYAGRLYLPDVVKLCGYALMLCGCVLEVRNVRMRLAQSVSLSERRRIARDMHDGLAQELAFITIYAQRLGRGDDDAATAAHLRAAAERALHESRTALAVLTLGDDTPLDALITRTADSFRSRFGVTVDLDLQPGITVEDACRTALLRILHEALTNAVRHGGAERALVQLTGTEAATRLVITDNGCGFEVPAALSTGRGLGLMSMSERAEMLGGWVKISSRMGTGSVVEVELP